MTRRHYSFALGLLISGITLVLIFPRADWNQVFTTVRNTSIGLILLRVGLFVLGQWLRGWRWSALTQWRLSPNRAFWLTSIGFLFSSILPLRSGEVIRAIIAGRSPGMHFSTATASIIVERLFDLAVVISLLSVSLVTLDLPEWVGRVGILFSMGTVAGLVVLALWARFPARILTIGSRVLGLLPGSSTERARAFLEPFTDGLGGVSDLSTFFMGMLLSYIAWIVSAFSTWALLLAFWPDCPLIVAVAVTAAVGLGMAVPAGPANIGTFESAALVVLYAVGYDPDISLSFALVLHATSIIMVALLGSVGLMRQSLKPAELLQEAQTRPAANA